MICFVLTWEFVRIISLSSAFMIGFAMKHVKSGMCVQEIESSLTKFLMFMSVFVIQDFMMQIYLVARCDKSWTRLRMVYLICVFSGVLILQG